MEGNENLKAEYEELANQRHVTLDRNAVPKTFNHWSRQEVVVSTFALRCWQRYGYEHCTTHWKACNTSQPNYTGTQLPPAEAHLTTRLETAGSFLPTGTLIHYT